MNINTNFFTSNPWLLAIAGVLWLVIVGSLFAYRVATKPYPDNKTWLEVVIGVAITWYGSTTIQIGLLFMLPPSQSQSQSLTYWIISLLAPWSGFFITGPIIILTQIQKHYLLDVLKIHFTGTKNAHSQSSLADSSGGGVHPNP
jgi:hypothetical protein